ncbi:hypothetical protein ACIRQQ_35290 [Streptomyces fuscichromogenes]|uniref:hypothetical protein n=1 Tax=Streptomyces fuscichromogenes TaxID=1324013 RepID=UPI0037FED35E
MPQVSIESPLFIGALEAPRITLLGSLDAEQGSAAIAIESETPKPFHAVIYTGI